MDRPINLARASSPRSSPGLALPLLTERLALREFAMTDRDDLCSLICDRRVTRYVFYVPGARCDADTYLRSVLGYQRQRPRAVWELAMTSRADGGMLGSCNLTLLAAGEADLGYMLKRNAWGQGLGTEAALALIEAAFGQLKLARIISTVDVRNAASIRILEKAGLRWEATYRKLRKIRGEWRDCHLFTLSREAWAAGIR
ncbi:MAG TPA: GNAT family protein [Steroidobacteraceae bacterium]|jgi:RimJ/RimL family protein N-acetyltransferase